jgi:hypothetical protein
MKKYISILILAFFPLTHIHAEQIGSGAASGSAAAQSNNWKNWTFAATALAVAAIGIYIVSINQGASSPTEPS